MKRRSKNSLGKILSIIIVLLIVAAGVFIFISPQFEKNAPKITFKTNGYWNLKDKLNINIFDQSGIKSYRIIYKNEIDGDQLIDIKNINSTQSSLVLDIKPFNLGKNKEKIKIAIEAIDNSKWNFLQGNKAYKEFDLTIDRKRPVANVITNSYNIKKGGSAAVVVEVHDKNLKDKYISFNDKYRFELIPFLKENYYMAIIAWPVQEEEFKRVNLVATDKAYNLSVTKVPLYIKDLKIKTDKIKISDRFVENISIPVLQKSKMEVPTSNTDIFVKQNKELRSENVKIIHDASVENMSKELITSYKIRPFKRLDRAKTFAGFAERRHYYYQNEKIDEAWHLGMDWASVKKAPIKVSNKGTVVFSDYLGIYGNTVIVDHGLGLQSLYAHTSKFNVNKGDNVKANEKIANTGSTGAVFGDHLHFGVLVQGYEVNPVEWMDRNWIRTRITDILDDAKKVIKSK